MFQFLRGLVLIAAMMLNCGLAFAEDIASANSLMVGCRLFVSTPPDYGFRSGLCAGIIEGLMFAGRVCYPADATSAQAIRVVVKYIDDRPARLNEDFRALAIEALRVAFPCKN